MWRVLNLRSRLGTRYAGYSMHTSRKLLNLLVIDFIAEGGRAGQYDKIYHEVNRLKFHCPQIGLSCVHSVGYAGGTVWRVDRSNPWHAALTSKENRHGHNHLIDDLPENKG